MDSDLRKGLCLAAVTATGFIKPLGWIASATTGFVCSKLDADEKYKQMIPAVRATIEKYGRTSSQAKAILDLLGDLPSFGACRLNFKQYYIDRPDGWRDLPDESKDLPYGFWY